MIQAAESLEDIYRLLRSFRNISIVIFPILYILSGVGIMIITGMSLKTLNIFSRKVSAITEKNLNERIEEKDVDKELKLLATSFNNMMARIEDAFIKQRQFLSDASHELRTPTSVIKSYCDVTLKKERNKAEREALEASKRLREFEQRSKTAGRDFNSELIKSSYGLKSLRLSIDTEYVKAKTAAEQVSKQLMSNIDDALLENTINQDPFLAALKKDLFERQTQLVKIQTKVKPGHYQLEEIKQQIQGDNKLIAERVKELIGHDVNPNTIPYSQDPLRAGLIKNLLETKTAELAIEQELMVVDEAIAELQKKIDKLPNEKYIYCAFNSCFCWHRCLSF